MMRSIIILFVGLLYSCAQENNGRTVNIIQGKVRGYMDPDGGFYVFYGIPYATAPSGTNRFKAPLPGPTWLDTLEAIDSTTICPQSDILGFILEKLVIKEQCLIANVYVPDTIGTNLLVVVYVHGGGFIMGFGNLMTYKDFVRNNKIVLVTFNYRLGPHGFLCLGTEDVPGNAGLKDQVALLRWVNKNIDKFGGNPEDVTIAGYSAGSASVDLLMLSKSAKGLFHKVIPESGANTATFSVQTDPIENAIKFARMLNYTGSDNITHLEEFYKSVSYDTLMSVNVLTTYDGIGMSPCIENEWNNNAILTESPVNILKKGRYPKVPMLYGFASMEGLIRIGLFEEWKQKMNDNFEFFLPPNLKFKNNEEKKTVSQKVKEFYFGKSIISEENVLDYVDYFSDILFTYPTLRSVKYHVAADHNQIYLYEFPFVHDDTPMIPHTNIRGANHCAQSNTISDGFLSKISNAKLNKMRTLIRGIWLNFITTGKPISENSDLPPWPPVSKNWSPHMSIDLPLSLRESLLKERAQFWDQIYEEHYRQPSPPHSPPILSVCNRSRTQI